MRKLKHILSIALCASLLLTQVSFVYAMEDAQHIPAATETTQEDATATAGGEESANVSEETMTEEGLDVIQSETETKVNNKKALKLAPMDADASDAVITPSMTQEEINAAIESADEVTVQAGDYKDKDLFVSGKDVRILAGSETTAFRFMKVAEGKLILENDLNVNSDKVIVVSEKSALNLTDATVEGNNKNLKVFCKNTGDNKPNAYCLSTMGSKVVLNDLKLTIKDSSNGDRGLLNINCTKFEAHNSNLQVCDNAGKNCWGSAGAPNICVGRDGVCAARGILFDHCTVNASGSVHPYGDGFQINKTTDPCTITFDTCKVNFDNNGGNGFMGQTSTGDMTKKVVVINSDVSACKNGGGNGASIGFANAAITLKNTDKEAGGYTFEVSDNYRLGIAANGLGAFTSINAEGYKIVANRNGVNSPDRVFGYGMYLTRDGSSFENCILEAEGNQNDGITLGGDAKVTLKDTEVRTVMNGSNGLVLNAETEFSNSTLLSACNGATLGDDVDTTANKAFTFSDGTNGSIGRVILNEDGTADDSSKVIALFDGESSAVTKGDTIYLLNEDGTVNKDGSEGELCHHVIDLTNGEIVKDPTDTEYGAIEAPCTVCGKDKALAPLIRIVYDKNTDDTVTNMPETLTDLPYGSDIPVSGTPERAGYTFTGWYLDADATQKCDGEMKDKDPTVTLYAGWEKKDEPTDPEDPATPVNPEPTNPNDPQNPNNPTTPNRPAANNPIAPAAAPAVAPAVPAAPVANPAAIAPAVAANANNADAVQTKQLEDNQVPLARADNSWALINFALMNLAVFESIMLLIGYFIRTKNSEEEYYEGRNLKKRGIIRLISIPVAIISVIAFVLTEDITNQTAFVDKFTILMAIIALVQTAAVALSRKKFEDEEYEANEEYSE